MFNKLVIAALVAGASAFSPILTKSVQSSTALFNGPVLGAGGMADTRDPDAFEHEDPRKSISVAPSFEEYLKSRGDAGGAAPAPAAAAPAPAPVAAAPAAPAPWSPPASGRPAPWSPGGGAAAPATSAMPWGAPAAAPPAPAPAAAPAWGAPAAPAAPVAPAAPAVAGAGGSVVDTLATLEGPGQVWGADGIAVGKEESDLKGYDNFGKFYQALQSTGVAAEIAGAGPFTIFAPTDTALETYETMRGPIDANVVKMHIVPGKISTAEIPSANLQSLAGPLNYRYAVRKHFVNDAIIGEKTFGIYSDFPVDVECSNGVIHSVGLCFAM